MKKIEIEKTKQYLYYKKIENGMDIYMIPKYDDEDYYVTFTCKYGSIDNEFIPYDSTNFKQFPNGIAHFLEHKMFEQEDGVDPMLFFSKSGTNTNALTNFFNTTYLFSGNTNFYENLNYLLDFVQNPYFTFENVEKEKGIIEQEIKMYDDIPNRTIYEKLLYNLITKHAARYSIAGSVEDIYSIDKEMLYTCYNTFYQPSNMFLVITGNFDPTETLKQIEENQSKKKFNKPIKIQVNEKKEDEKVLKLYEEKDMNIEIPYLAFGIKIPKNNIQIEKVKLNMYFSIIFNFLFSKTSLFYEENYKNNILSSSIGIDMITLNEFQIVTLTAKSSKYKELIKNIEKNLKNIDIDEDFLERKKKVYISSLMYSFEDIEDINFNIVDDIVTYGKFNHNLYSIIKSLNKRELDKIIKYLNLKNTSSFVIK